jgi:transcriptional regulator GlxA family with amidase domain
MQFSASSQGTQRESISRLSLGAAATAAGVTPAFLSACCRLLDILSTPDDIPSLSGLIEREIVYRILRGPEGARLRAIATLGDQSHRTAKAIACIKANCGTPLRLDELAEVAGMAVSTLHHHFRAITAMSPLQYQKQIRLRMLANDVDAATGLRGWLRKRESVQS